MLLVLVIAAALGRAEPVRLVARDVAAFPGEVLALPVRHDVTESRRAIEVTFSDGAVVRAPLLLNAVWDSAVWDGGGWLREAYSLVDVETDGERSAGFCFLTMPAGARSAWLEVDGVRTSVRWLDDRGVSVPEGALASPVAAALRTDAGFLALIEPLRADPVDGWRVELALGQLGRMREVPDLNATVAAITKASVARRWRLALGALHAADAGVAAQVRGALVSAVEAHIGDGSPAVLPVMPASQFSAGELLELLLGAMGSPARLASEATAWLERVPTASAWARSASVIGGDEAACLVEVANWSSRPRLALVSAPGGGVMPVELAPQLVRRVSVVGSVRGGAGWAGELRIAGRGVDVFGGVGPVGATPRGGRVGPTVSDWTARTLVAGEPVGGGLAFAWIERATDGGWRLLVTAGHGEDGEAADVEVWLGRGESTRVVSLAGGDGVALIRGADATLGVLAIPDEAIEGGRLWVGLTARHGALRAAWPAPRLPGQDDPGRGFFDLTAWDSLPR